ncbi:hypothetical protein AAFC00_001449 [Neodothiora populina]|uniref:Peroxisomal membrane protein PEX14 n=1 Tax=Neodothiora populina TaxID=2781224 RepID=A0ABR3PP44_9PEZI
MAREELINSAVFLQDPSVANAPLEQRMAFLRSKNLTQEEIDLSLQRAGSEPASAVSPTSSPQYYQPPQQYRPQQSQYTNGPPPPPYWQQGPPPPPELPRRDWRDWFIMATVMGGLSLGAYTVAKRYIVPLIAPPTPPQLEQDKASVDAQFDKAFALLDQLATDTEELKKSEQDRTERLDAALAEVESVIGQMKEASRRRDDEGRRIGDDLRVLKDMIPRATEAQKESQDQRLKDLAAEMKSLKTLISNRVAAPPAHASSIASSRPPTIPSPAPGVGSVTPPAVSSGVPTTAPQATEPTVAPDRSATSSPYGRLNGRAAIPAWQMAAAKKNQEAKEKSGTVESANGGSGSVDAAAASSS